MEQAEGMGTDSLHFPKEVQWLWYLQLMQAQVVAGRKDVCAELLSDTVPVCSGAAALGIRPHKAPGSKPTPALMQQIPTCLRNRSAFL